MVSALNAFGPIARPTAANSPANSPANGLAARPINESRFLSPDDWTFPDTPPAPMRQPAWGADVWHSLAIPPHRQRASADPVADVPTGAVVMGQESEEDHPSPVRDLNAAFDAVL